MKKIILLILFCIFVFLSSCDDDNQNTVNNDDKSSEMLIMEDIYFFRKYDGDLFYGTTLIMSKSPVKINPVSKTASYICVDPLCTHEKGCPLYRRKDCYVTGNYLFFTDGAVGIDSQTGNRDGEMQLCVYDMINGKVCKLGEKHGDNLTIHGRVGKYLYYTVPKYSKEDKNHAEYIMYRADAESGDVIIIPLYGIALDTPYLYPYLYDIVDNKIFWFYMDDEELAAYTTDLDGKNKTDIDSSKYRGYEFGGKYSEDGYSYYAFRNASSEEFNQAVLGSYEFWCIMLDNKLYRVLFDSGDKSEEPEILAESVMTFAQHGDKIYYTVLEDNPELIDNNGEKTWNWSGGKVYVMNSDGSDKHLLCDTGYNLRHNIGRTGFFEVKTINGIDYLALAMTVAEKIDYNLTGYTYVQSSETLIINGSTGEYALIYVPE